MGRGISDTMLLALREIEERGDPSYSAYGMSERGGRAHTEEALIRRGLAIRAWFPQRGEGQRVMCYFCVDNPATGLALEVGGEYHGEAMPACSEEEGTAFVELSESDRRQMFGPFEDDSPGRYGWLLTDLGRATVATETRKRLERRRRDALRQLRARQRA